MSELSARARSLVERARTEATPSAKELVHLRARLAASLAQQTSDPVPMPLALLGKLAGVAMLAAVGLGAWHLRGMFDEHERPAATAAAAALAPAPAPAPPVVCAPAVACPPAPPPQVKVVACAPAKAAVGEDGDEAERRRRRQESIFSAEAAQHDPSLELELLILARVALDEDRSMDALGHTLKHESLYPNSAFAEERLAIQVLAYCASGNLEQATARFARLMELAPETAYLPRVRGTCGDAFVQGKKEPER